MRIKIKDLELAIEHIKSNSISETIDFEFSHDGYGLMLEFSDKLKNIAKAKLYDANINLSPEITSTRRLYRED